MRISDWSSDVCSSDLLQQYEVGHHCRQRPALPARQFLPTASGALPESRPGPLVVVSCSVSHRHARTARKRVAEGKGVSVRLDLGGGRILTQQQPHNTTLLNTNPTRVTLISTRQ